MNKFKIDYNGGAPLWTEDVEFMQNALQEALLGLGSFYDKIGDPIIISGLTGTVTGGNVTFTSGFIAVNGEIYYVPGATIPTGGGGIDINETTDPLGDKIFENGDPHSAYVIRKGTIVSSLGAGVIDLADFRSVTDTLVAYGCSLNFASAWVNVSAFNSGWSNYAGSNQARYRKNNNGEVEITGFVKNPTATGQVIFQLPVGFRPVSDRGFIVMSTDDVGTQFNQIIINTNGNITLFGTFGTNKILYLNQLRFTTN